MELSTVWMVCDPTPVSELADILWEQKIATLHHQVLGGARNEWAERHFTMWTTESEATADAETRMAARVVAAAANTCPHCGTTLYDVVRADGSRVKVTVPE